jgi:DNA-binding response OmpR family regulator
MRAPTLRIILLKTAKPSLPFLHDLLASIAEDVVVADLDAVADLAGGQADLIVIARGVWSEEDTVLCATLDQARSGVPLLAISGPAPFPLRAAALRAGADEFLTIPFEVDELSARAFALLRLSTRGGVLRVGAFVVDAARRRILVNGAAVPLTLSEYDVLAALVAGGGGVVTRPKLASCIGSTATSESNIVDVLISRIREKLGANASAIETVRGLGYRFRPDAGVSQ